MLTGRGRYVSDWNLPGQTYAHFLRSDRAHAEIVSIDAAEALRIPLSTLNQKIKRLDIPIRKRGPSQQTATP